MKYVIAVILFLIALVAISFALPVDPYQPVNIDDLYRDWKPWYHVDGQTIHTHLPATDNKALDYYVGGALSYGFFKSIGFDEGQNALATLGVYSLVTMLQASHDNPVNEDMLYATALGWVSSMVFKGACDYINERIN